MFNTNNETLVRAIFDQILSSLCSQCAVILNPKHVQKVLLDLVQTLHRVV